MQRNRIYSPNKQTNKQTKNKTLSCHIPFHRTKKFTKKKGSCFFFFFNFAHHFAQFLFDQIQFWFVYLSMYSSMNGIVHKTSSIFQRGSNQLVYVFRCTILVKLQIQHVQHIHYIRFLHQFRHSGANHQRK